MQRAIVSLTLLGLIGCTAQPRAPKSPASLESTLKSLDHRPDWTELPASSFPRHPAEKYLAGLTIVIDPGHGGDAWKQNWKRSQGGTREAEINLRVSLLLARLLKDADVNVILTRESDTDLDLDERAGMANSAVRRDGSIGADLFISVHHNATSSKTTNFTSVWYHGTVDDNEPDLDVARYVAHALGRHMHTQVARTAPVLSSHLMYPSGFGVLRTCNVPAILCECSFFTDPVEEQRLKDASYNLREAYGIYEGLCEWAYCGRPTQTIPAVENLKLMTTLDDGLPNWWGKDMNRIVTSTINVTLDGERLSIGYDSKSYKLATTLPSDVKDGDHVLWVHHANMYKNHNWPQRYLVHVNRGEVVVKAWITDTLPASRPSLPTTQPATTRPAGGRGSRRAARTTQSGSAGASPSRSIK
jgi:N-acetylmuramoyl-L-alanine amidase